MKRVAVLVTLFSARCAAWAPRLHASRVIMSAEHGSSRREALRVASSTLGVLGAVMGAPSNAVAANAEKLQQKYGLPPLPKAPDGFSQILSVFGKANSQGRGPSAEQVQREPIFVSFNYPSGWITKSPLQASARACARACAPRSPLTSVLRALAARI